LNAYGMSMRLVGEIIGKENRDQRSGVRDQKRNDLDCGVRIDFEERRLDRNLGAGIGWWIKGLAGL